MNKIEYDALIKQLKDYENYGDMIDAVLKMDDEKKLLCMASVAYSEMQEQKDKDQMMLFIKIVSQDIDFLKSKKKKLQWYKAIYDKTFVVKEAENNSFGIGVNHDKIHNFLVDRLDLN